MKHGKHALIFALALCLVLSLLCGCVQVKLPQSGEKDPEPAQNPGQNDTPEPSEEPKPEDTKVIVVSDAINESYEVYVQEGSYELGTFRYQFRRPKLYGTGDAIEAFNKKLSASWDLEFVDSPYYGKQSPRSVYGAVKEHAWQVAGTKDVCGYYIFWDYESSFAENCIAIRLINNYAIFHSEPWGDDEFYYFDVKEGKELDLDGYLAANGLELNKILEEFNASDDGKLYVDEEAGLGKPLTEQGVFGVLVRPDRTNTLYYRDAFGSFVASWDFDA